MYDHRAVTLICFECDQDFSNGSGCTQHGNLVGETDTSERRPAIARRFPVRGLDASHDRGASLKRLGRCLRRFLSPCSHRETKRSQPAMGQNGLRSLRRRVADRGVIDDGDPDPRALHAQGSPVPGFRGVRFQASSPAMRWVTIVPERRLRRENPACTGQPGQPRQIAVQLNFQP